MGTSDTSTNPDNFRAEVSFFTGHRPDIASIQREKQSLYP